MQTYEITVEDGKVVLCIGSTKGGLTLLQIDGELKLDPEDAKWLGRELQEAALDAAPD